MHIYDKYYFYIIFCAHFTNSSVCILMLYYNLNKMIFYKRTRTLLLNTIYFPQINESVEL